MESRTKKRLGAIVGGIALACVAGVALAAFLSSGSGSSTEASTEAVASTIAPDAGGTGLYPGATVPATVTVNNPNAYPIKVVSIAAGSSSATTGGCPAATVSTAALTNPGATIAPGATGTYTLQAKMIADPDNKCQKQTFTVPLTASIASAAS